jgi:hypothetical protein
MSEKLEVSNDVKQWLINLINKLGALTRIFETVYNELPAQLLVSFIKKCDGMWNYEVSTSREYFFYWFKCNSTIFRISMTSYKEQQVEETPFFSKLIDEEKIKAVGKPKEKLGTNYFEFELGHELNLLSYHGYELPVGIIEGEEYILWDILALESYFCFHLRTRGRSRSSVPTLCVGMHKSGEPLFSYYKQGAVVLSKDRSTSEPWAVELLSALFKKRDEIDRRINPILKTLDETIKMTILILLY